MPLAVPSKNEILSALAADPLFPLDSVAYEASKDYVALLPEIIGEERLGRVVDFSTLLQIEDEFLGKILDEGFGYGFCNPVAVRDVYQMIHDNVRLASDDIPSFLASIDKTEHDVFLSDEMDLNEKLQEDFKRGTLTFGDIVRTQPAFFLQ